MDIKHPDEIQMYINQFILETKIPFLIEQIYKIKSNWYFHFTEYDSNIKTAAVIRRDYYVYDIFFNRNFLKEHVKNKNDLVFVFLHEFFHIINGDLLRDMKYWKARKVITNIIFDIKINSEILKNYSKNGYHFLRRFYKNTKNVFNLLLYPLFEYSDLEDNSIFENGEKQLEIVKKIENMKFENEDIIKDKKKLAMWYINAWFKNFSLDMLLKSIEEILKINTVFIDVVLIGNHNNYFKKDEVKKEKIIIDEFVEKDNRNAIINIVKKILEEDGEKLIIDKFITTRRGVLPNLGRRETFFIAGGVYPFFFKNLVVDDDEFYKNTHIYIDVSGSVLEELPFIYKLIESIKLYISEPIYLFSTKIEEISIEELKNGEIKTTYGTDFNCVILHAINNNFKKILIITDGRGSISDDNIVFAKEKNIEIFVILTTNKYKNPFEIIAKKTWLIIDN